MQKRITQCPPGTCTLHLLANTEITHGLPVGTVMSGFNTVLNILPGGQVSQVVMTKFGTAKGDYSTSFGYDDYAMINGKPEFAGMTFIRKCLLLCIAHFNILVTMMLNFYSDCTSPTLNSPICGTYETYSCMGVSSGSNAQLIMTFLGTGDAGSFYRTYRQWAQGNPCQGVPDIQYNMQGTYAVHDQSSCGGSCIYVSVC